MIEIEIAPVWTIRHRGEGQFDFVLPEALPWNEAREWRGEAAGSGV